MSEQKTVLEASVTGTFPPKDRTFPEAYKITVLYSDGNKMALRKTYQDFIELQDTVYDLLKQKGGYSKKTAKSLIKSLPELHHSFSQSLFKEDDLKKIERLEKFIKELLILPAIVRNSERVNEFFGTFKEKQTSCERSENEEKLKRINKVAEVLSGRDPLRTLPPKSPLLAGRKNKADLSPEDQKPKTNKILTPPVLLKRPTSEQGFKANNVASTKPDLTKRQLSVGVGIAEMFKDKLNHISNITEVKHSKTSDAPRIQPSRQIKQSGRDENNNDTEKTKSGMEEPCTQTVSAQREQKPRGMKYSVISSYVAEESGEVSLQDGEEVAVVEKRSSGWWYVKKEGEEGWVPGTFLKPVQISFSRSPETLDLSQGKEILDAISEGTILGESEIGFHMQEQQKSLSPTSEKESEEKESAEMDRRVKLISVEGIQKRKTPDKIYVYILKVLWSDGSINIIYRQCRDFFLLQENLKKEFPKGTGKDIPALTGRKFTESCQFCFKDGTCKRRQSLNKFFHVLTNAPDDISNCQAVMLFCRARPSDLRPHGISSKTNNKTNENDNQDNVQISGPVVFEQYVAIADYREKNKNDISLTAGDTVDVIEKNDFGWWLVDREGELGWAPASHLEPNDDGAESTSSKTFAPGQEEAYISVQSYEARAKDELSFDIGVTLKVVEKNLDGWWLARYRGKEGWVPAVFLSLLVESDDSSSSSSGKICGLDIVSSKGDSENNDCKRGRRSPPTRRSMIQRSFKKKPNKNATVRQPSETTVAEDLNQGDRMSLSSGYRTSSSSSLSSLVSDASAPEESAQCAIPASVDSCVISTVPSLVFTGSNPVTTLAQDRNTSGSALNGSGLSSGRRSPIPSPRRSPIPSPRSRSPRRNPQPEEGSPLPSPRSRSPRRYPQTAIHDIETTPRESYSEKGQENDSQNTRYQAMHTYISQEKNEITINEGDIVEVLKKNSNGWWLLTANDHLGWGPSNFLQPV